MISHHRGKRRVRRLQLVGQFHVVERLVDLQHAAQSLAGIHGRARLQSVGAAVARPRAKQVRVDEQRFGRHDAVAFGRRQGCVEGGGRRHAAVGENWDAAQLIGDAGGDGSGAQVVNGSPVGLTGARQKKKCNDAKITSPRRFCSRVRPCTLRMQLLALTSLVTSVCESDNGLRIRIFVDTGMPTVVNAFTQASARSAFKARKAPMPRSLAHG